VIIQADGEYYKNSYAYEGGRNLDNACTDRKICGFCGEDIPAASRRCPYCGSVLETVSAELRLDNTDAVRPAKNVESESSIENPACDDASAVSSFHGAKPLYAAPSGAAKKKSLSNGMKVFLTSICTLVPCLGQLAGIIAAIIFLNSDDDADRRSFGAALLTSSLVVFVVSVISCFFLLILFSVLLGNYRG
jgi:hypothetical protein